MVMDDKGLRRLLGGRKAAASQAGWRCPDEMALAAFVEHRASAREVERIESHLADCAACLDQVTFLVREPEASDSSIAPHVQSRARDLITDRPRGWRAPVWRWGAVAATAAGVVLALSLQSRVPEPLPSARPATSPGVAPVAPASVPAATPRAAVPSASPAIPSAPAAPERSTVRHSAGKPVLLTVLSPAADAALSVQQVEFVWSPIPTTAYYEIHLVTEDGNVVWLAKTDDTRARPPAGLPLVAGGKYFVWVRAYLSGGGTVKSAAVPFHIGGL